MKQIQTTHSFVTLAPDQPLDHLWNSACCWTQHERLPDLRPDEIDAMLAASIHYRLVEARTGCKLRWYPPGNYGFWHHRAKLLGLYAASEWVDVEANEHVILLQGRSSQAPPA